MDVSKKGFLKKDYDIFYIKDKKSYEFTYHFHDFHKVVIFLKGVVHYIVEGRGYKLEPFDVLIVRNNEIHKPEIDSDFIYERIVIWIKDVNLIQEEENIDLLECFKSREGAMLNLLRFGDEMPQGLHFIIEEIKRTFKKDDVYGKTLMRKALFIQLMVYINERFLAETDTNSIKKYASYDQTIQKAIAYINANLKNELKVETIAESLYMSKYHLMRKFKKDTGYTMHSYILKKRLIYSKELMRKGKSAYNASVEAGFGDYSTFVRSYKRLFNELPSKLKNKNRFEGSRFSFEHSNKEELDI